MEMSQGNSLYSYLKQTKCHYFPLQDQRTGGQNRSCLLGWYQWKGEDVRKGCRKVNMVQILCVHVCKWKTETVKTILRMGDRRRDKEE
jgi:hypothetical protein